MPSDQTACPIPPLEVRRKADRAWEVFFAAAKVYADYLDQWDKVKFMTEYGMVYVSIGRAEPYPDSFEEIDNAQS